MIKSFFTEDYHFIWRFKKSTFQEQKLFFTAQFGREGGDPDIVGLMDPNNGEIVWKHQIENTEGLYEEPQVANDKLYVRSVDNILHIFEKE